MRGKALAVTVVLVCLEVATVFGGTTGQLGGTVFDETGLPIMGVSVTVNSPSQIGAAQMATTGADGRFRFPRLAPGYYSVMVEYVGYAPQQLEQVQVRLDRVTEVKVVLEQTSFVDQIEVMEITPVVDPAQISTGQTFTTEYITATSTDWTSLIEQTPGASNDSFRRVLGSTGQDGAYQLDGMDSTNWYQRFPNLAAYTLPFDAIQEVAVHSAGFEAEFGQATGAVVNVFTKSGGNAFAGTADIRYSGSRLETSGEHYDPNEQESEFTQFAATLGGPILRDRMWFFTSFGRNNGKGTPLGAPTTREDQDQIFLGKITWQPGHAWSLVGKYNFTDNVTYDQGSSEFRTADATSTWHREPTIATFETVGVLSASVLWSLRLGRKEWYETGLPTGNDFRSIGHYNLETGVASNSWGSQWYADSWQNEVSTDVSWLLNAAGTHELKAGLSAGDPWFLDNSCGNGSGAPCTAGVEGFNFDDLADEAGASVPYLMWVEAAEGPVEYGSRFLSAFVQDAWRVRPNVTFKAGLRWDRVRWDSEIGEVADLSMLQPRVGVAWDIGSDGRTLARASWGRFMHPGTGIMASWANTTTYPAELWFSCSYLSQFYPFEPEECPAFAGDIGVEYRTDPDGWDESGWLLGNVLGSEPSQVVDGLKAGYADELLIGFERELTRRTSVEITYVNKQSYDMFDDTCNGNYPERDPDGACDYYVVANMPEVTWDYEGLILRFETRALDNLHLLASWVISESKGSIDANTGSTGAFDVYPYHFVNRYGHLWDHSRHRVKLNGYWILPYDFAIAFEGWWDSEFRWTPYDSSVEGMPYGVEFLEPRGSEIGGDRHRLNLQFSKGFRLGPTRVVLLATVLNAIDSENEDDICGRVTGCGEHEFGDPIGWQQPRRYELGFRVEF